jgi:hypothetical protein
MSQALLEGLRNTRHGWASCPARQAFEGECRRKAGMAGYRQPHLSLSTFLGRFRTFGATPPGLYINVFGESVLNDAVTTRRCRAGLP